VLFYTCAGGPDGDGGSDALGAGGYLPTTLRNRLLRRALSFQPEAMVANGDHVYWDLHAPRIPPARRDNTKLQSFNRSALVFGDRNETVLKRAAGPQIVPVYGTDFRSTPVFFLQDDHDYFDNDEAFDEIVTFPPVWFQLELARATQRLYYPEFLPDENRPRGLPWGAVGEGAVSESWGTLRFGRLAEILLYEVRRTCTLAGPSAVFIDAEVEKWLLEMPEVKLAYVIGVPHADRGEDVAALLVLWGDSDTLTPELVRERLRRDLSSYKIPRHVFVIGDADVPWLVSQKVDRRAVGVLAQKLAQS